jgi:hypothetical protein
MVYQSPRIAGTGLRGRQGKGEARAGRGMHGGGALVAGANLHRLIQ